MKRKPRKAKPEKTESPQEIRSRNMRRVKSRDTSIEVAFRRALWRAGIRYRKNYGKLPGKPDIAIVRHKIAVFCDGEFWHGKDWGEVKERLQTRRDFWIRKIERNIERDNENEKQLAALGWTVFRFWGRDIKKNLDLCVAEVVDAVLLAKMGIDSECCYDTDETDNGASMVAEQTEEWEGGGER